MGLGLGLGLGLGFAPRHAPSAPRGKPSVKAVPAAMELCCSHQPRDVRAKRRRLRHHGAPYLIRVRVRVRARARVRVGVRP